MFRTCFIYNCSTENTQFQITSLGRLLCVCVFFRISVLSFPIEWIIHSRYDLALICSHRRRHQQHNATLLLDKKKYVKKTFFICASNVNMFRSVYRIKFYSHSCPLDLTLLPFAHVGSCEVAFISLGLMYVCLFQQNEQKKFCFFCMANICKFM